MRSTKSAGMLEQSTGCEASDCKVVPLSSHLTTNQMLDGQRDLFDLVRGLLLYDLYQMISEV